jgi:predicted naringenin-chalcone synthase
MGCYAAIHALKMADAFCSRDPHANVLIVCTELCTLHFQRDPTVDNLTSSLLFGDGSAAVLVSSDHNRQGLTIDRFYSTISLKGKREMAWELSSSGFLMTLGQYVAGLIEEDFDQLVTAALGPAGISKNDITHWCIHPGGKKILEAAHKSLGLSNGQLDDSYDVLRDYGNMSSATVLFVLKKLMESIKDSEQVKVLGAAFGPGLTLETFILSA